MLGSTFTHIFTRIWHCYLFFAFSHWSFRHIVGCRCRCNFLLPSTMSPIFQSLGILWIVCSTLLSMFLLICRPSLYWFVFSLHILIQKNVLAMCSTNTVFHSWLVYSLLILSFDKQMCTWTIKGAIIIVLSFILCLYISIKCVLKQFLLFLFA